MIRYIAYVGPKPLKKVEAPGGRFIEFPQGETVDLQETDLPHERARELLRTGVFQLRSAMADKSKVVPVKTPENPDGNPFMEPPRYICACGFVAKSGGGLAAHMRACSKK
jgi:hypothetical protein